MWKYIAYNMDRLKTKHVVNKHIFLKDLLRKWGIMAQGFKYRESDMYGIKSKVQHSLAVLYVSYEQAAIFKLFLPVSTSITWR